MLQLQPHLTEWRERGFDVYFVTMVPASTAIPYLQGAGFADPAALPLFTDPDQAMVKAYKIQGVPTSFVVDAKGIIQEVKVGWGSPSLDQIQATVDRLCPR